MQASQAPAVPSASSVPDRLGVVASTACALHCAVVALLPAALGALGLGALLGHEAEWAFTLAAVAIAAFAAFNARNNGSPSVLLLLGAGIVGLLGARFIEEAGAHEVGTAVAVASGIALVLGHVQNLRTLTRKPEPCCEPE